MATETLESDFKATLEIIISEEKTLEKLQDKMSYEFHCGRFEEGEKLEKMVRLQSMKINKIIYAFENMWEEDFEYMRHSNEPN